MKSKELENITKVVQVIENVLGKSPIINMSEDSKGNVEFRFTIIYGYGE